ncbi:hypothetical protein KCV07_g40, partial [Aureobasidium melanogenum]
MAETERLEPQELQVTKSCKNAQKMMSGRELKEKNLTLTSDRTRGTQFREQELSDVLVGSLHTATDFGNVCENGLLVSFTQALRRRDLVRLAAARGKVGVVMVELGEEAGEQQRVLDGCGVAVLPDAGSLFEIALLAGGWLRDGLVVVGLLVGTGLGQLGLKVGSNSASAAGASASSVDFSFLDDDFFFFLARPSNMAVISSTPSVGVAGGELVRVSLGARLVAMLLGGLGDLAVAVDDSGALAKGDRLARLALFLYSIAISHRSSLLPECAPGCTDNISHDCGVYVIQKKRGCDSSRYYANKTPEYMEKARISRVLSYHKLRDADPEELKRRSHAEYLRDKQPRFLLDPEYRAKVLEKCRNYNTQHRSDERYRMRRLLTLWLHRYAWAENSIGRTW